MTCIFKHHNVQNAQGAGQQQAANFNNVLAQHAQHAPQAAQNGAFAAQAAAAQPLGAFGAQPQANGAMNAYAGGFGGAQGLSIGKGNIGDLLKEIVNLVKQLKALLGKGGGNNGGGWNNGGNWGGGNNGGGWNNGGNWGGGNNGGGWNNGGNWGGGNNGGGWNNGGNWGGGNNGGGWNNGGNWGGGNNGGGWNNGGNWGGGNNGGGWNNGGNWGGGNNGGGWNHGGWCGTKPNNGGGWNNGGNWGGGNNGGGWNNGGNWGGGNWGGGKPVPLPANWNNAGGANGGNNGGWAVVNNNGTWQAVNGGGNNVGGGQQAQPQISAADQAAIDYVKGKGGKWLAGHGKYNKGDGGYTFKDGALKDGYKAVHQGDGNYHILNPQGHKIADYNNGKGKDKIASPVALDLNGDGRISTTGVSTAKERIDGQVGQTIAFDIDGDGTKEQIEWITGGDGLVVDMTKIGANGEIDGNALMGDQGGRYADGYQKMATYDQNGDGQLTGGEMANMGVWVDANGNGTVDAGELRSAADAGVTQLSTQRNDVKNERGETLMQSTANNGQMLSEDVWFAKA
ncbi:hypothetical protein [Roseibium sediminis]|uniref:hypothetical protein n=1 Tax=Roseibium sediminis TaxID=1775174 RepID=UPI00123D4C07|nr:hypothetical protein [Roseibium sediminis]